MRNRGKSGKRLASEEGKLLICWVRCKLSQLYALLARSQLDVQRFDALHHWWAGGANWRRSAHTLHKAVCRCWTAAGWQLVSDMAWCGTIDRCKPVVNGRRDVICVWHDHDASELHLFASMPEKLKFTIRTIFLLAFLFFFASGLVT